MSSEGAGISVMLADDHAAVRAGIRLALAGEGFNVVAEAADAPGAVEAAKRERPDIALLDVNMPGSGIKAAEEISQALPGTVVVMLTVSRDDDDLFAALRAGASGYLLKDTDPGRLPFALRGVLEGEAALPRGLVARLIEEFRTRGKRRRLPLMRQRGVELTEREWEVLDFLHDGLSTAEIAERMAISPVTVRRHVSEILKKLRVETREEAVRLLGEAESPE
ncbi:MAG: response regulator [Thermoleophilaceae bacterium]